MGQKKLSELLRPLKNRQMRTERYEACILILKCWLKHLDLATLSLGMPTENGFQAIDRMRIAAKTGMPLRRCQRAIADLKKAGLITVQQHAVKVEATRIGEQDRIVGLRATRKVTKKFFAILDLGGMLINEVSRAANRLHARMAKAGKEIKHGVKRGLQKINGGIRKRWIDTIDYYINTVGIDMDKAHRQANIDLGLLPGIVPSG
jgi:hypothetical protein